MTCESGMDSSVWVGAWARVEPGGTIVRERPCSRLSGRL